MASAIDSARISCAHSMLSKAAGFSTLLCCLAAAMSTRSYKAHDVAKVEYYSARQPLSEKGLPVPIRYMGTKRQIAGRVRRMAEGIAPPGKIADLFSGMGSVASALADFRSVVTNDALQFTAALARARFMPAGTRSSVADAIESLRPLFRSHSRLLSSRYRDELRAEAAGMTSGRRGLVRYMKQAEHAGNSESCAAAAASAAAARTGSQSRYCMASLYYGAGYFSLRQAIHLDSLRYAIDAETDEGELRDWLLAAWLSAAGTVMNAPGHTAQFLKPNTDAGAKRIVAYWSRSIWLEFQNALTDLKPVGLARWRRCNRVVVSDALDFLDSDNTRNVGLIYADPPYTRDQYSRYYHVYETLYKYDFPLISGEGRAGPHQERFSTGFSLKTGVEQAFKDLFGKIAKLDIPLLLSYPSKGLLAEVGCDVRDLAAGTFNIEAHESFSADHSTMGASQGLRTKVATENLYVCRPI